jgi:hypothetical protein
MITILSRALSQQYALGYDSHVHRRLTQQCSKNQDITLITT